LPTDVDDLVEVDEEGRRWPLCYACRKRVAIGDRVMALAVEIEPDRIRNVLFHLSCAPTDV
jgi:hypothetical protein